MTRRRAAWHLAHVAAAFAVTLGGMLTAAHQPVTRDLVVSLLPAAAVATLRTLEAKSSASGPDTRERPSSPAPTGT